MARADYPRTELSRPASGYGAPCYLQHTLFTANTLMQNAQSERSRNAMHRPRVSRAVRVRDFRMSIRPTTRTRRRDVLRRDRDSCYLYRGIIIIVGQNVPCTYTHAHRERPPWRENSASPWRAGAIPARLSAAEEADGRDAHMPLSYSDTAVHYIVYKRTR